MDELHAAIAARLRRQRRQVAEDQQRKAAILNIWQDPYVVPRSKICDVVIDDDDGGLYNLAHLSDERGCADHYIPF